MRRRSRGERSPLNAEIDVVSLIDVMMLLMVIFMITAPIMQGGVDVSLPKAEATPLEPKSGLVISIDRNGHLFADDTRMTMPEFRASVRLLASKQARDGVYVRADEGVPYGIVVQVFAMLRAAGITNVGLVLEPEQVAK